MATLPERMTAVEVELKYVKGKVDSIDKKVDLLVTTRNEESGSRNTQKDYMRRLVIVVGGLASFVSAILIICVQYFFTEILPHFHTGAS